MQLALSTIKGLAAKGNDNSAVLAALFANKVALGDRQLTGSTPTAIRR